MTKGTKLSLLMISLTVLFMAALMSGVIKSDHWEISNIELDAEFKRISSEQIRVVVAAYPMRSFFKVNASEIRENLMALPWAQSVIVNKKWPNTLIIKVHEHKAVAVWNVNQLLNEKGEVFDVDSLDDLASLPYIYGKDMDSKPIWEKYVRFNEIIKSTGFDISNTHISSRGGWQLNLSNGLEINLGSQQMDSKLVRLADTWTQLLKMNDYAPQYIDLRYTNGYVAKWPQIANELIDDINTENQEQSEISDITNQPDSGNING